MEAKGLFKKKNEISRNPSRIFCFEPKYFLSLGVALVSVDWKKIIPLKESHAKMAMPLLMGSEATGLFCYLKPLIQTNLIVTTSLAFAEQNTLGNI